MSFADQSTESISRRAAAIRNQLREMDDELSKRGEESKGNPKELHHERTPLLGNIDVTPRYQDVEKGPESTSRTGDSTSRSAKSVTKLVVTDERVAEEIRSHFDYPPIKTLCFIQIGMSLGYIAYTTTAWLYIGSVRHDIFPECRSVWMDPLFRWACETTVLAFWTFPLFCCFFLLCFYYRDLLCTRLYYEMLAHNVFLDFENVEFTDSSAVRVMLVWMVVALCMYPMSGTAVLLSFKVYKMTVPYWLPLGSFLGLLYASWDLESRLLSLSKYVEREFDMAKDHMGNSVFIRDHLCEFAFRDAQKHAMDNGKVHSTGSYIRAIVKRAQALIEEVNAEELAQKGKGRSILHSRFLVVFSNDYWVSNLLYCPTLDDDRAMQFRRWFKLYKGYTYMLLVFLLYLMVATVITHLHLQHILETSWLTRFFNVEIFLILPQHQKSKS